MEAADVIGAATYHGMTLQQCIITISECAKRRVTRPAKIFSTTARTDVELSPVFFAHSAHHIHLHVRASTKRVLLWKILVLILLIVFFQRYIYKALLQGQGRSFA